MLEHLIEENQHHTLICGDFNLVLDPTLDSEFYKHVNKPCARNQLLRTISTLSLIDIYRTLHANAKRYTW